MKVTKIGLIQTTILTAILFINTGCFLGFVQNKPKSKLIEPVAKPVEPKMIATQNTIVECTDEVSSPCQKKLISPQELPTSKNVTHSEIESYQLQSIQGENISIEARPTGYVFQEFKNKIVILQMFGKSCSHCIKEMTTMRKLQRRYPNHLKIVALQVEEEMSKREAHSFLKRHRISYPIIAGNTATNLQYHVQNTFGWTGILPFMMVIKDGVTEFTYRGSVSYNRVNKDIRSLLK